MTTVEPDLVKNPTVSVHKILVAVDLTEHSKLTTSYAVAIAKCFNSSVVLVHVFEPVAFYDFPNEYTYQLVDEQRRDCEMRLAELTDTVREMKVACQSLLLIGDPAERIGPLARELEADLIVTASHHPKFMARLFNLDKAPQIMRRAPCPVLVYHDKAEEVGSAGIELR
jgi:nucleotide-binding universal stress UspA family protein